MKKLAAPILLATVLLLSGCGGSVEAETTPTPITAGEVAIAAGKGIPKLSEAQKSKLLADIKKINPDFINRKTVDNARNQCMSILDESPEASLLRSVRMRFAGLGVESVSDAEGKQLLAAISSNGFCDDYEGAK